MKYIFLIVVIIMTSIAPAIALAQTDTTIAKNDSTKKDSILTSPVTDTVAAKHDTAAIVATPMNCYKQWFDYFTELGSKTVTDGPQLIVIAFKSKESCHCYMGKVEVAGGKIKSPVLVQTEGGEFKSFVALGKKLDPEFVTAQGDAIWSITNGMSVLFQTTEQEYGRVFFYKFLNKNKQMSKEAPSPSELLK